MKLLSLHLENFKNYESLSFDFGASNPTILVGNNGQGKTNFLEAIVILALSKSYQSVKLPEMVNWDLNEEQTGLPEFFRIRGTVETKDGKQELEVFCGKTRQYPKTLKVNGVKVRAGEYLGHLRIVLFTPQDLNIVMLSPQLRRRSVDLMISQVDREYLHHLSKYQIVVKHRNKLLGAIQVGQAVTDELTYWDEQLVNHGSYILWKRKEVFDELNQRVSGQYERISGERVELEVRWKKDWGATVIAREDQSLRGSEGVCVVRPNGSLRSPRDDGHSALVSGLPRSSASGGVPRNDSLPIMQRSFTEYLRSKQHRDIDAGTTCGGPHREDFEFVMNGRNLATSGSRGECRSAVLALKLSEREFIQNHTGESPVLLFDDVLSELDPDRQKNLLGLFGDDQVMITSTHLDEPVETGVWRVEEGALFP